jgi:hypothetical protein
VQDLWGEEGLQELSGDREWLELLLCLLIDDVEICPGTDLLAQAKAEVAHC